MPVPAEELYDQHADDFDAHTALEELPEEFNALLESFVDGLTGPDVLDAGCGPGRDTEYFHTCGLDPVGIDFARGMVEYARAHRPGQYLEMDIRNLAFESDQFDGLWCPATIFFVPTEEMETALNEFARVLRPSGVARIGFKLGEGPVEVEKWGATTMEYHVSEEQARALLDAAGFRVESVSVNTVSPERTFANFYCQRADSA
ncbi:class I SAM-dependent DNA methyltransferase [Halorussus salinisoli]|uniref:class I SAM-dependent DNA methyltransferase n=1 Tax=Halorussus salinisoli TaxID=2558242 RepID=UPI0010C1CE97|nr:class I SAM-dependent methyltransferase [Halorussus salinisoli]